MFHVKHLCRLFAGKDFIVDIGAALLDALNRSCRAGQRDDLVEAELAR